MSPASRLYRRHKSGPISSGLGRARHWHPCSFCSHYISDDVRTAHSLPPPFFNLLPEVLPVRLEGCSRLASVAPQPATLLATRNCRTTTSCQDLRLTKPEEEQWISSLPRNAAGKTRQDSETTSFEQPVHPFSSKVRSRKLGLKGT